MPRARGEERVPPEVAGLPSGDLIEQVRFGAAVQRRGRQHRVLELAPAPPRPEYPGRNRSRMPSSGSGSAGLVPDQARAPAASRRKTSPWKVLSRGRSGSSSPSRSGSAASWVRPVS